MAGADDFAYARGQLSVGQLQAEIVQFWEDLDNLDSSALEAELSKAGFGRAALAGIDRTSAITVRAGTSGVDPTTAVILVTLAPSANRVIKDLWATVVLPRIRKRWGEDAIGEDKQKRSQD
jgi:hypothetical protein